MSVMSSSIQSTYDWLVSSVISSLPQPKPIVRQTPVEKMSLTGLRAFQGVTTWTRAAGLCGAAAVGLGAYGAHVLRDKHDVSQLRKMAFETGNRYHLIHSVALLASPLSRHPTLTAALFLSGIVLFSGTCYHYGLTGKDELRRFTPVGGFLLIFAWLSLVF